MKKVIIFLSLLSLFIIISDFKQLDREYISKLIRLALYIFSVFVIAKNEEEAGEGRLTLNWFLLLSLTSIFFLGFR